MTVPSVDQVVVVVAGLVGGPWPRTEADRSARFAELGIEPARPRPVMLAGVPPEIGVPWAGTGVPGWGRTVVGWHSHEGRFAGASLMLWAEAPLETGRLGEELAEALTAAYGDPVTGPGGASRHWAAAGRTIDLYAGPSPALPPAVTLHVADEALAAAKEAALRRLRGEPPADAPDHPD